MRKAEKSVQLHFAVEQIIPATPGSGSLAAHVVEYAAAVRAKTRALNHVSITNYLTTAAMEQRLSSAMPPAAAFKAMIVKVLNAESQATELALNSRRQANKALPARGPAVKSMRVGSQPFP